MMKKLLPFLCASALALSLTACAGTINNSTADTASNVTFTFTDSGVTAAGETDTGYEIDGTALTITSSGTYTVSGSCADGTDGPTIDITNCCEGLEGAELNVCSGDITINASDDCLNAANSDLTDYDFTMTISGGTIDAYSSAGDGFDSNGELTITGGTVIVWTANTADNEPLDADGTITVSGGTVLAAGGSSGMGMNLEAAQPCVIYGSMGFGGMPGSTQSSLIAADADFTIEDADGNAVYSGTTRCGANFILFSSADVVADSAYTLKAGDSSTEGTAQSGTVSTGMGMGGGFPGGGQKPDGEPPEGFDGQMPNGEKPELPDGEVPEMPSGERPTPPSGQGSPADGSAPAGDSTSDTTPTA